jgi:hypothetical protein
MNDTVFVTEAAGGDLKGSPCHFNVELQIEAARGIVRIGRQGMTELPN